jgi:predicted DNA-binding transcriptional regulator AlpA
MTIEFMTRQEGQISTGVTAESSWFRFVKNGLLPSPVYISTNSTRYIKSEIETITVARVAGYSDAQIKVLVVELQDKRLIDAQEYLKIATSPSLEISND